MRHIRRASVKSVDECSALETWLVQVRGRGQGIVYREARMHRARALGITGWVRNRMDESVEAMLQGSPAVLAVVCDWMRDGYSAALVGDIKVTEVEPPFPRLDRFELQPTL
ncbi:acylphosphatase [Burkholderiaceae bacterium 16]|nr:acylphosphatase [Burkholderiaceae bacterium 16]